VIRNIVADGPSGELEDLHMTYVFEHRLPHIKEGTHEAEEELKKFKGVSLILPSSGCSWKW
jgi:hypothetical protein